MNETEAPAESLNGALPDPPAQPAGPTLPEGTIQLPPALVARLTRLMQETPAIHDVLYAFIEGREATGRSLTLVVPVILLMPPKEG
jgi:hypothetical protein